MNRHDWQRQKRQNHRTNLWIGLIAVLTVAGIAAIWFGARSWVPD